MTESVHIPIRFNEVDPLGIVWHGHYVRYFEDGREAFGKKFGLTYLDVFAHGFVIPIVSIQCDYKRSPKYGDTLVVETSLRALQGRENQIQLQALQGRHPRTGCYRFYRPGFFWISRRWDFSLPTRRFFDE
jgi:YbgC/YbaW family acyl-CoA thioester hydrolase